MSLPPITIPDLDPAGAIDRNNDLLLLRQGLNDKKVTVAQIANLDLAGFDPLPSAVVATDKIIIGRNNGSGGYINYIADPRTIGFLPGVTMWFYANTAPLYWRVNTSLGDRVLAVKGGSNAYTNWGLQGTWTQPPHVLTIAEMPRHSHTALAARDGQSSLRNLGRASDENRDQITFQPGVVIGFTGGDQAHNHGNNWRPLSAVGVACDHQGTPT